MPTDDTSIAPTPASGAMRRELLAAFRRGDVPGMLLQLGLGSAPAELQPGLRALADLAVATRRESVATLGSHEAFVRRLPGGDLRQVVQGVRLSLADKTLYQIPIRRPFAPNGEMIGNVDAWRDANPGARVTWREISQASAEVTYQGYLRQNAVAGCAVGSPPTVMVDGEARTNPYFQRAPGPGGRPGDIVRVVVAVVVVGPAPATGNPVAVNYVLDYDPSKDLLHMLGDVADKHPDDVYLIHESQVQDAVSARAGASWTFVPLYGGVGYMVNLRIGAVREVYQKFCGILQDAQKKAQTVARRNAMRAHPALATHTVAVDASGGAVVGVTGWAMDASSMARWMAIQERIARGGELGAELEVLTVAESYDADRHSAGLDGPEPETRQAKPSDDGSPPADSTQEINLLIEHIDTALGLLAPSQARQIADMGYADPTKLSLEDLRTIAAAANRFLETR